MPSTLDLVEGRIRNYVWSARVRLVDGMKDFDKLKSGYISREQFRRCLVLCIEKGPRLSNADFDVLFARYDTKNNGTIDYSAFVESIEQIFGQRNLEKTPSLTVNVPGAWLRDTRTLSPEIVQQCNELIDRIRVFVRHHGHDVKSWFRDFDRFHSGLVTANQFRRGFPPGLLSVDEIETLLLMFNVEGDGVNYVKLNTQVNRRKHVGTEVPVHRLAPKSETPTAYGGPHHPPIGTEIVLDSLFASNRASPSLDIPSIIAGVKKFVFVHRIRLASFFRDRDLHNNGIVTEAQFRACVKLARLDLCVNRTSSLIKEFATGDGRVSYRRFCDCVDEVFTSHSVEADPTIEIHLPTRDTLVKHHNKLSSETEQAYQVAIEKLNQQIARRRINMNAKDLDAHVGAKGQLTKSQLTRILSMAGLVMSETDLYAILDKLEDPYHVNYLNLLAEVKTEDPDDKYKPTRPGDEARPTLVIPDRPVEVLMDIINGQVYMKGLRVSEFLRDYDHLRTGHISKANFIRGLNQLGLNLSPGEYAALADRFSAPDKQDLCRWRDFEIQIEEAHGKFKDLEKRPTLRVSPPEKLLDEHQQFVAVLSASERRQFTELVRTLTAHLSRRSMTMTTLFADFDKLRTGRVSSAKLRQVLSWLDFDVDDVSFELVRKQWTDPLTGDFSYLPFLSFVATYDEAAIRDGEARPDSGKEATSRGAAPQHRVSAGNGRATKCGSSPAVIEHPGMPIDVGLARSIPAAGSGIKNGAGGGAVALAALLPPVPLAPLQADELEALMLRIKTKVKTERIRVYDALRDHDARHCGRITHSEFERALDRLGFLLTRREAKALANHFAAGAEDDRALHGSPAAMAATMATDGGSSKYVNYRAFSDSMESVFTTAHLERTPTATVTEFKPHWHEHPVGPSSSSGSSIPLAQQQHETWGPQHDKALAQAMNAICESLRQRRMYFLLRYLEDHDKIHNGTITRGQLWSALIAAGLHLTEADVDVISFGYSLEDNSIDYLAFEADLREMLTKATKGEAAQRDQALQQSAV
ncbi:hypothetical protein BC828DRAFT_376731 [Blastocladiella britannica]|nr:hypothetical protein BC828DRAFT_376731 [Blastocladiella britannica]